MDVREGYKDLPVWRKSIALAAKVYAVTRSLPSDERFTLDQQLRQSAVCVASMIAGGWARRARSDVVCGLHSARAALLEVEVRTMIAIGQGYVEATSELPDEIAELGILLNSLIRTTTAATQLAHAKACTPHRSRMDRSASAAGVGRTPECRERTDAQERPGARELPSAPRAETQEGPPGPIRPQSRPSTSSAS